MSWLVGTVIAVAGCGPEQRPPAPIVLGDADRGRLAVQKHGCGGCHVIPGVRSARGAVGPSLAALVDRRLLAGSMPNTPANLVDWIRHPRALEPRTFMPDLAVSDADARDIAAFLYRRQ